MQLNTHCNALLFIIFFQKTVSSNMCAEGGAGTDAEVYLKLDASVAEMLPNEGFFGVVPDFV